MKTRIRFTDIYFLDTNPGLDYDCETEVELDERDKDVTLDIEDSELCNDFGDVDYDSIGFEGKALNSLSDYLGNLYGVEGVVRGYEITVIGKVE